MVSLYVIAKRFLNHWTALAISAVFFTQPLLFGHAFINPKDIPLMGFFTATIACGLVMADRISKPENKGTGEFSWKAAWSNRKRLSSKTMKTLLISAAVLVSLILLFFFTWDAVAAGTIRLVESLFQAPEGSLGARVIDRFVSQNQEIPLSSYQDKAVHQLRKGLIAAASGFGFLLAAITLWLSCSDVLKAIYLEYLAPALKTPKENLQGSFSNKGWIWISLTGIMLGLTTAIRVIGPAALALILIYFFTKDRRSWLISIIAVLLIACLVTYISWPYLWDAPLANFFRSVKEMSNFTWQGKILFEGQIFPSNALPRSFLPKLLFCQLTEPVIFLAILGLGLVTWMLIKRRIPLGNGLLILGWALLPIFYVVIAQPVIYDNGRQFFFLLPAIFILAGYGLDAIFSYIKKAGWKIVVIVLILLPGLIGIFQLHPYQYLYYNRFAGGLSGAYGRYELDYWGTTLREAAEFLNREAPPNARIAVMAAPHLLEAYTRDDLVITPLGEVEEAGWPTDFDYLVLFTRANGEINNTLHQQVIFRIIRDGVNLLTIEALD
jgi:MFS family permease